MDGRGLQTTAMLHPNTKRPVVERLAHWEEAAFAGAALVAVLAYSFGGGSALLPIGLAGLLLNFLLPPPIVAQFGASLAVAASTFLFQRDTDYNSIWIMALAWCLWGALRGRPIPALRSPVLVLIGLFFLWEAAIMAARHDFWILHYSTSPPLPFIQSLLLLCVLLGCGERRYRVLAFAAIAMGVFATFSTTPPLLHKNLIGREVVFALGLLLSIRRSWLTLPCILAAITMGLVGPSGTSRAATALVLAAVCWFWLFRRFKKTSIAVVPVGMLLVAVWFRPLLEVLGKDSTFTGRTGIWGTAVDWIKINPYFGNGADFWLDMGEGIRANANHVLCDTAHNSFLEAALLFGIPASVFLAAVVILAPFLAKTSARNKFILFVCGVFPMLTGVPGFVLISQGLSGWGTWLLFCLALPALDDTCGEPVELKGTPPLRRLFPLPWTGSFVRLFRRLRQRLLSPIFGGSLLLFGILFLLLSSSASKISFEELWLPRGYYLLHTDKINHINKARSGEELLAAVRRNVPTVRADRRTLSDIVYVKGKSEAEINLAAAEMRSAGFDFQQIYGRTVGSPTLLRDGTLALAPSLIWLVFLWIVWPARFKVAATTALLFLTSFGVFWTSHRIERTRPRLEETSILPKSSTQNVVAPYPEIFKRNLLKLHTAEIMMWRLAGEGYYCGFRISLPKRSKGLSVSAGSSFVFVRTDAPADRIDEVARDIDQFLKKSGSPVLVQRNRGFLER